MFLNNKAQKLYLNNKIKYNDIIMNFIFNKIKKLKKNKNIKFKIFYDILNFINE